MLTITKPIKLAFLNSDELLELQKALTELNYNSGPLDGIYGEKTLLAFNKFKTDYGLTNLGEIGPTTVKILQMALAKEFEKEEVEKPHSLQPILSKPNNNYADFPNSEVSSECKGNQAEVINWFDFNSPISKYFTVGEVCQWDKNRIVVNQIHRQNVLNIAKELDKIRTDWGKPIGVTSWYRPYSINKRVGGVPNSTHITGSAVDIYPIGGDIWAFQKWLDSRWQKALGWGAKKGFVHIDLRSQPKRIRWNY